MTAREKRAAYRNEDYWGKPVPGFGDPGARLLIVGLAPAAHGGNRTGRMFTGDGSASFLVPALYRAGFASKPESAARNDGLRLKDAWMTAVVRCAPPFNKPTPREAATCREWLIRECRLLRRVSAVLVLGRIAMDGFVEAMRSAGHPYPRMAFRHGAEYALPCRFRRLFVSYHPSRQNTQTGRLTARMLDSVLRRVRDFLNSSLRSR
jgi:uracil-DNA glycosylase family 4